MVASRVKQGLRLTSGMNNKQTNISPRADHYIIYLTGTDHYIVYLTQNRSLHCLSQPEQIITLFISSSADHFIMYLTRDHYTVYLNQSRLLHYLFNWNRSLHCLSQPQQIITLFIYPEQIITLFVSTRADHYTVCLN